jgi:hypothetical protein
MVILDGIGMLYTKFQVSTPCKAGLDNKICVFARFPYIFLYKTMKICDFSSFCLKLSL